MARFSRLQISTASAGLAAAVVIVSVVCALSPLVSGLLLLSPSLAWFAPWQFLTYGFIEVSPLGVIFGAFILYQLGMPLEARLGRRRFLVRTLAFAALSGIFTAALRFLLPSIVLPIYAGGSVLTSIVWVSFGLAYGAHHLNFFGWTLQGRTFALIGVGFVALQAAFAGLGAVLPVLFGIGLVYLAHVLRFTRNPWTRFQSWRLERTLKKSRPLHIVNRKPDDYLN